MTINYRTKDLETVLNNKTACQKQYGSNLTASVMKKLKQIASASSLAQLRSIPGHFHELKYQAKNVFSLTLRHPYRLIMAPTDDYKAITVLAVEDYHNHPRMIQNYIS